jgi:hypothetical protein
LKENSTPLPTCPSRRATCAAAYLYNIYLCNCNCSGRQFTFNNNNNNTCATKYNIYAIETGREIMHLSPHVPPEGPPVLLPIYIIFIYATAIAT